MALRTSFFMHCIPNRKSNIRIFNKLLFVNYAQDIQEINVITVKSLQASSSSCQNKWHLNVLKDATLRNLGWGCGGITYVASSRSSRGVLSNRCVAHSDCRGWYVIIKVRGKNKGTWTTAYEIVGQLLIVHCFYSF